MHIYKHHKHLCITYKYCKIQDLAARNILLGKDEICKVGDFGLLRKLRKLSPTDSNDAVKEVYVTQSTTPLPIRWMAPESLDCDVKQFSTASDVWSFGVLQWEMKNPDSIPYAVSDFMCTIVHAQH